MAWVNPLPEDQAVDKVARSYERIKELLGAAAVPPVFLLYGRVGAFLLSDMSDGITGETLHIDGGYNIMGSPGRLLDAMRDPPAEAGALI